jgi:hypothetical protein
MGIAHDFGIEGIIKCRENIEYNCCRRKREVRITENLFRNRQ